MLGRGRDARNTDIYKDKGYVRTQCDGDPLARKKRPQEKPTLVIS